MSEWRCSLLWLQPLRLYSLNLVVSYHLQTNMPFTDIVLHHSRRSMGGHFTRGDFLSFQTRLQYFIGVPVRNNSPMTSRSQYGPFQQFSDISVCGYEMSHCILFRLAVWRHFIPISNSITTFQSTDMTDHKASSPSVLFLTFWSHFTTHFT